MRRCRTAPRARPRPGQNNADVLMAGEGPEPQRWLFSPSGTCCSFWKAQKLMLKACAQEGCREPGAGPLRHKETHTPQWLLAVFRSSCSPFFASSAVPRHCKTLSKLRAREPLLCFGLSLKNKNHRAHPYPGSTLLLTRKSRPGLRQPLRLDDYALEDSMTRWLDVG